MSKLTSMLAEGYERDGWTVYTDYADGKPGIPPSWKGSHPDMVIVRGDEISAVMVADYETLRDPGIADKWRSVVDTNNVELIVVVRDKQSRDLVKEIAKIHNIRVTLRVIRRHSQKSRKKKGKPFKTSSRFDLVVFAAVIVIIVSFIIMYLPAFLAKFKMREFYMPKDIERQETIKRKIEEQYK